MPETGGERDVLSPHGKCPIPAPTQAPSSLPINFAAHRRCPIARAGRWTIGEAVDGTGWSLLARAGWAGGDGRATHPPAAATRVVVSDRLVLGLIASPAAHAGCAAAAARATPLRRGQSIEFDDLVLTCLYWPFLAKLRI